jgi:hypothetical protein
MNKDRLVRAVKPEDIPELVERAQRQTKYAEDAKRVVELMKKSVNDGGYGLVEMIVENTDKNEANRHRGGVRNAALKMMDGSSLYTRIIADEENEGRFKIIFSPVSFDEIPFDETE